MVKIVAHAGADHTADNTLESIRYLLTTSADALEVDVRPDGDGRLILSHDSPVEGDPPALEEVFALLSVHPGMEINCDLKVPGLERAVCGMAAEAGLSRRLILTGALDPAAVPPGAAAVYWNGENAIPNLYEDFRYTPEPDLRAAELLAEACLRQGISVVNVHYLLATDRFVQTLRRSGVRVSAWTVDAPEDLKRFFELDIFSVTTRSLSTALRLRRS